MSVASPRRTSRLLGRRRPALPWLAAAALLAVAAALLTARAAAGRSPRDLVLVARAPIAIGTDLGSEEGRAALATVALPEGLPLAGLVRDPAALAGRRAAVPIAPGEPLTEAALGGAEGVGPAPLRPGERAISVPSALAGAAGAALRAGMRVDVVATAGEGPIGRSAIVVSDAEVLAADTGAPDAAGAAREPAALLRVSPREALRLTEALGLAQQVRILIRPVSDAAP
jgi:Flp pilus assembly protein CpaB